MASACSKFKTSFRQLVTQELSELFDDFAPENFYLMLAKVTPWDDDNAPPAIIDSVQTDNEFWRDAFAIKKISQDDITFVIPRYNWFTGETYDQYEDDKDLFPDRDASDYPKKFFVVVDGLHVYKCLDNGSIKGDPDDTTALVSTEKPDNPASVIEFTTSDGYTWKYMYQLRDSLSKFFSPDWVPVEFVGQSGFTDERETQYDVQQAAVDGGIYNIRLKDTGSAATDVVIADNTGDQYHQAYSSQTTAEDVLRISNGANLGQISSSPTAYVGYTIRIVDGPGAGQIKEIIAYDGDLYEIQIDSNWDAALTAGSSFYEIVPTVVITGDGSGATALAKVGDPSGVLTSIEVVDKGTGYKFATATIFPTGIGAVLDPIIAPMGGHGANALKELGSVHIMIDIKSEMDEIGNFAVANDFRQFGIIYNPTLDAALGGGPAGSEITRTMKVTFQYFGGDPNALYDTDRITESAYQVGNKVIGNTSFSVGTIDATGAVDIGSGEGTMILEDPTGPIQVGEDFNIVDPTATLPDSPWAPITAIVTATEQVLAGSTESYRQTIQFTVEHDDGDDPGGVFDTTIFSVDDLVVGTPVDVGVVDPTATVVSWVPTDTDFGVITVVAPAGVAFDVADRIHIVTNPIDVTDNPTDTFADITVIVNPEIVPCSGEVIYIQNTKPIQRGDTLSEEFKIVIGF